MGQKFRVHFNNYFNTFDLYFLINFTIDLYFINFIRLVIINFILFNFNLVVNMNSIMIIL